MNRLMENYLPLFGYYQDMKSQFLALVSDADLAFQVSGNPSLGALAKEMGETQQSYVNSLKPPYKLNFSYRNEDVSLAASTTALQAWYADLDAQMTALLEGFTDEQLDSVEIGRGTWMVPIQQNMDIYKEAVLIFCAKAWVYLQALGKPLPEQWSDWLG